MSLVLSSMLSSTANMDTGTSQSITILWPNCARQAGRLCFETHQSSNPAPARESEMDVEASGRGGGKRTKSI